MRVLRKLAELDRSERALLAWAVLWVLAARLGLALLPFPRLQRLLDGASARRRLPVPAEMERVRWATTAAARRVPGTRCLAWALAFRGLLGQAGISSELRIGVAKGDGGGLKAHAWVDSGGKTFSWGDDVSGYAVLRSQTAGEP
jgi:hypothetical protein